MPTKRRRRARKMRQSYSQAVWTYMETGELPDGAELLEILPMDAHEIRAAWSALCAEILAAWIRRHPGTRPAMWWNVDAPKTRLAVVKNGAGDGDWHAQRARLGGIGTPEHEVLNAVPRFGFGLPLSWVDPRLVEYYNGRARDIHGNRIGTEYADGHFVGVAPDPADPPKFEAQAAFLARHGLLTPNERERLGADAFEPEAIDVDIDVAR